eukprot:356910-Chlamydomonas_euryale.AAC.1
MFACAPAWRQQSMDECSPTCVSAIAAEHAARCLGAAEPCVTICDEADKYGPTPAACFACRGRREPYLPAVTVPHEADKYEPTPAACFACRGRREPYLPAVTVPHECWPQGKFKLQTWVPGLFQTV